MLVAESGAVGHAGGAHVGRGVSGAFDHRERVVARQDLRLGPEGEAVDRHRRGGAAVQVTILEGVYLFGGERRRAGGVDRAQRQPVRMYIDQSGRDDGPPEILAAVGRTPPGADGGDPAAFEHDVAGFKNRPPVAGNDRADQGAPHAVAPMRPQPYGSRSWLVGRPASNSARLCPMIGPSVTPLWVTAV